MRVTTVLMSLALVAWQATRAAGQNAPAFGALPPANVQYRLPIVRPGVDGTDPNAPPISAQARYRYLTESWRYRNPSLFPSYGQGNEWAEYEPHVYGDWFYNRLRPPVFSRYSFGYRPQWNPYSNYRYGYRGYGYGAGSYGAGGFGDSYYGYGYYDLR